MVLTITADKSSVRFDEMVMFEIRGVEPYGENITVYQNGIEIVGSELTPHVAPDNPVFGFGLKHMQDYIGNYGLMNYYAVQGAERSNTIKVDFLLKDGTPIRFNCSVDKINVVGSVSCFHSIGGRFENYRECIDSGCPNPENNPPNNPPASPPAPGKQGTTIVPPVITRSSTTTSTSGFEITPVMIVGAAAVGILYLLSSRK